MNYYVLSATQSDICPISLSEEAVLYNHKEQIDSEFEYGSLPWYSYKTSKNCELPRHGVLVLKNRNTKISFRNINADIYVVDGFFKEILQNYINVDFFKVELVSSQLDKVDNNDYYFFRFNEFLNYSDVFDLNKSVYRLDGDFLVLEEPHLLEEVSVNIFKINKIDSAQDTFFINETVKSEIDRINYKGIRVEDVTTAKWRDSGDFSFMLLEESEVNEFIWPI
ncbi:MULTISPECIES: hypothetical protein [Acinetobacter]|uniref:hypothetical protein n=1 Tax=Acinetobacter TaxID=469 RepID=UPI00051AF3F0|nr:MULTISPECIES: hypothetical protein [Acinetobacter]MCH7380693.1 hypothetical protein [Acinetobacter higginsii]MCJ0828203.1 hypothetical protein [Acinetobacter sp. NIPH1876]